MDKRKRRRIQPLGDYIATAINSRILDLERIIEAREKDYNNGKLALQNMTNNKKEYQSKLQKMDQRIQKFKAEKQSFIIHLALCAVRRANQRIHDEEMASFTGTIQKVIQKVENLKLHEDCSTVKKGLHKPSVLTAIAEGPSKPQNERVIIPIYVQDKEGAHQFCIHADDKLELLFKLYADKVELDQQNLVFCFDGEKVGPEATPDILGLKDDDVILVHLQSRQCLRTSRTLKNQLDFAFWMQNRLDFAFWMPH